MSAQSGARSAYGPDAITRDAFSVGEELYVLQPLNHPVTVGASQEGKQRDTDASSFPLYANTHRATIYQGDISSHSRGHILDSSFFYQAKRNMSS